MADKLAEAGVERLRAAPEVSLDVRLGLSPAQLAKEVGAYDALIIRSGVQVTREVLASAGRLRAIARAGVGVDNVDVDAATAAGILVLNTPDANTISTAEHTLAMILAVYRRIPFAHAHVLAGQWQRNAFIGHQLAGQVLGLVGLGRVGRAVALRALAFEMQVVAYDPFVQESAVLEGRVSVLPELANVLRQVDCMSLHATLSPQTRGLIGAKELALMKPTAVLVNCARGELVDEAALAVALNVGRLGGAAVDVFSKEPPSGNPLLSAKNIVLTPHLGASTEEAQTAVSVDAVEALLDYLLRGQIRWAVNLTGLPAHLSPRDRAYLDLCSRMATLLSSFCGTGIERIRVTTYGESLERLTSTLARQAVVDLLSPHLSARLNLVNAEIHARSRGIALEHVNRSAAGNYTDSMMIGVGGRDCAHAVEGTVFIDGLPRILAIDEYRMEMVPEGPLVLIFNDDRPGVIGLVGTLFGRQQLNIADMTLSRRASTALMLLKLDEPAPPNVLDELRGLSGSGGPILSVQTVSLPPIVRTPPARVG
ncbi:MAG TPA: phosphoglycerate dehydrogenase [Phycisphaerae bacterium]